MSETTTETTTENAGETSADTSTAEAAKAEAPAAPEVRDPAKLLSAYEAEKAKRREQDNALRDLRAEFDALKAKNDGKEAEFLAAQEAQKVKDEAIASANQRILKAEIRAAAAGKVNPDLISDLPVLMDLSALEVGADGEVDTAAIEAAITDLITKKPSLGAQGGQRFKGAADGGARTDATKPSQLTRDDMKRMSPEQVVEAEAKGQFDDALGRS